MTITIRRATAKDAAAYARIMGEADVFSNLLQMPYADEEVWRQRLGESTGPGKSDIGLVAELDGEVVGNAGMHPVGLAARGPAAGRLQSRSRPTRLQAGRS